MKCSAWFSHTLSHPHAFSQLPCKVGAPRSPRIALQKCARVSPDAPQHCAQGLAASLLCVCSIPKRAVHMLPHVHTPPDSAHTDMKGVGHPKVPHGPPDGVNPPPPPTRRPNCSVTVNHRAIGSTPGATDQCARPLGPPKVQESPRYKDGRTGARNGWRSTWDMRSRSRQIPMPSRPPPPPVQ